MPKYKFIYNVSEGIFQMDVFTGIYIIADNKEKALDAASRLDDIVSTCYKFTTVFEFRSKPNMSVNCIRLNDGYNLKPQILKYQIQQGNSPEFFDDVYVDISENTFLEKLQGYFSNCDPKHLISFDAISYEVQEVSSHLDNHLDECFSIP